MNAAKITPGVTTFRSHYADSNPLWKVLSKRGRDTWLCEIQNEPIEIDGKLYDSDWSGQQKAFLTKEINASIGMSNFFDQLGNEHDRFYASLKPGQTVHYHNGFQSWVRCTVVVKDGQNVLLPIALVGNWSKIDLPKRLQDGSIRLGYHCEKISNGETMTPNASNIVEHTCKPRDGVDPSKLAPIDLSVPDMTEEQKITADKWARIKRIKEIASAYQGNPDTILAEIASAL